MRLFLFRIGWYRKRIAKKQNTNMFCSKLLKSLWKEYTSASYITILFQNKSIIRGPSITKVRHLNIY